MDDRTSVITDAMGRQIVAKVARTGEQAARLENEAALLEAGRHPGVAELVGIEGHGVGSTLLTVHVEGPAVSAIGCLPPEEAAGLLAALATTLADLHDLGLVHGAVCPEHIVIGPAGRPVLCSLGYGGRVGEPRRSLPPIPPEFTDPRGAELGTLTPAGDVFGLGALARSLVPSPPFGHALATLAEEATADDVSARPGARAVAESLHRQVPAARLPRGLVPRPPAGAEPVRPIADPLEAWRRERSGSDRRAWPGPGRLPGLRPSPGRLTNAGSLPKVLAAAAVALVVGVGLFLVGQRPAPAPSVTAQQSPGDTDPEPGLPDEAPSGPTTTRAGVAPSTTTVAIATSSSTTAPAGRRDCPVVTAVLQADVDGDGCPDAMRYAAGVLEAAGLRWSVGQVGDQVATGNWGCQGGRTVALFRPGTGELFRFDAWASPERDVRADAIARVDGGQLLRAADLDRDGCHEAVVERAAGLPAEVVRLPRAQP